MALRNRIAVLEEALALHAGIQLRSFEMRYKPPKALEEAYVAAIRERARIFGQARISAQARRRKRAKSIRRISEHNKPDSVTRGSGCDVCGHAIADGSDTPTTVTERPET